MSRVVAALCVASLLSGCAAPPNTPGAGTGKDYTPIIDTQGLDTSRYDSDLAACRKYSGYVDAQGAALSGAIGGALLGATLSAMVGGSRQQAINTANVGAFSGSASAGGSALAKQERIMINCMAGRGYRTLDGGQISPVLYAPQPAATAAAAPATPQIVTPIATSAPRPDLPPADQVALGVATAAPAPTAGPRPLVGQFSYQAERLPEVKACNPVPAAKLSGKGPGVESYTVACSNGDLLSVRCEFSNCRVLR